MSRRRFGYVRQLASGRWQASYMGPDGVRYRAPHTFSTEAKADKWVRFEEALIETGQWDARRVAATPLFGEFCEKYINSQTTRSGELLKPTTKHHYRTVLRVHLGRFHDVPLHEIDTPTIREWWSESIADGKLTSRSRAYKLLSATLGRAVEDGLISHNPCTIKGSHSAETGKEIVVPSAEELARIINCMNPRYKTMTMLIANSGLRFGEAAALERSDLSVSTLEGKTVFQISVNKTTALIDGEVVTQAPKSSASIRDVKLRAELTEPLEAHLLVTGSTESPRLFPNASGGYVRNDVFTNSFRRALKKAGADPGITPHSLRHFAGSEYGRAGANVAELSKFLGDKSKTAVLRYLHSTDRGDTLLSQMRFIGY